MYTDKLQLCKRKQARAETPCFEALTSYARSPY